MNVQDSAKQSSNSTLKIEDNRGENTQLAVEGKKQLLLEWISPARQFRKRGREYYTTGAALVFLIAVILFLIKEWLAIGALLAVAFVAYVFSVVPPEKVKHRITTFGVETVGYRYSWLELYEFWFEDKWGEKILSIQTRLPFPGRIHILLGDLDKDRVKQVLQRYLPYKEEPSRTFVERIAEWISRKIPLEATA